MLNAIRFRIMLASAIIGSTLLYWRHINRAVSDGDLCRRVERHVRKLGTDNNGAIREDALGLVDNIEDLCMMRFSKAQAKCVLKAATMADVQACE